MSVFLELFIPGKPATAGSKRIFPNKKTGKFIVAPDNKRAAPWTNAIQGYAMQAMGSKKRIESGPIVLEATFILERPKSHYRTGSRADELKNDVPAYPTSKPDLCKMVRCLEDALTGIVWKDDSQVVIHHTSKLYANPGKIPGVLVYITRVYQIDEPPMDGIRGRDAPLRKVEWKRDSQRASPQMT